MRILSLAVMVSVVGVLGAGPILAQKSLIEFGWDEPGTEFMREHIDEMEMSPFDGCVFHVDYDKGDGGKGSFTWECWGKKAFTYEELTPAVEDLKATRFRRFTGNFLRFNTTPADRDWFDDFGVVANNATLAARAAKEGGVKGILFDIEQYNSPLWQFSWCQKKAGREVTWEELAKRVRECGEEFVEAVQEEYPDIVVFLTFGYSLPWVQSDGGKRPLEDCSYGLLAPFLDGMVAKAGPQITFVDGYELSYTYTDAERFQKARETMSKGVFPIVADAEKYRKTFRVGFGIWMDADWRRRGWNTEDFSKNVWQPEMLEKCVAEALRQCDEYVWIYTETPRWWTPEGGSLKVPEAYRNALIGAKRQGKDNSIGRR
jgi:hypothetical protein